MMSYAGNVLPKPKVAHGSMVYDSEKYKTRIRVKQM